MHDWSGTDSYLCLNEVGSCSFGLHSSTDICIGPDDSSVPDSSEKCQENRADEVGQTVFP